MAKEMTEKTVTKELTWKERKKTENRKEGYKSMIDGDFGGSRVSIFFIPESWQVNCKFPQLDSLSITSLAISLVEQYSTTLQ